MASRGSLHLNAGVGADQPLPEEELFERVVGQPAVVAALRSAAQRPLHAYMFLGNPGTTRRAAALAFAAALLCPQGGCGRCPICRAALAGAHPDVAIVERTGVALRMEEVREAVRVATTAPSHGRARVVVVPDAHLLDRAAPALLKTVEEPPDTTVFVLLADHVPPELRTLASRCAIVRFAPLSAEVVARRLVQEGVPVEDARSAAAASGGRIDRARLLVSDQGIEARKELWRSVPSRLESSGATVCETVVQLLASLDEAIAPLRAALEEESNREREEASSRGTSSSASAIEERHRRELRRARTEELRRGLSFLSASYRDRLVNTIGGVPETRMKALLSAAELVLEEQERLVYNPNETLQLQALLLRLCALAEGKSAPARPQARIGS